MASKQNASLTTPNLPSWVEASIFESVLQNNVNGFKQTKNFKAYNALSAGENYATIMLRIEIEVELNDGSSQTIPFMLKTAHDNDMFRDMLESHNIFEVEATMYREVIPEFEQLYREAGVEVKFGTKSFELATDQPYILLENLNPLGFKNESRLEGLDMEHTEAALTKLAQWHAASAVRVATKGPYKPLICESFFGEESREMMKAMFGGLGDLSLNSVKSYEGHESYYDRLHQNRNNRLNDVFEASKVDLNEFNVLNHGDFWSNNIMFKHDASGKIEETFLIDYQVPRYGSPAQDLYYFILTSTNYDIKLKQFDYFIKYYYDKLIENLTLLKYPKKLPTLRDIHIMLHKRNAWAISTVTGAMAVVLFDAGTQFKGKMFSNARYRKHAEMILPWLNNRGAL